MLFKEKILFTKDECELILKNIKEWDDTPVGVRLGTNLKERGGIMDSYKMTIWGEDNTWIKDRVVNWVNGFDDIVNKIDTEKTFDGYFRKYEKGGYIIKHIDSLIDDVKRIYTIGIMLHVSDDIVGGNLKLYIDNETKVINFKIGNVYLFDSDTPHSVDLLKNGERITLMFFIDELGIKFVKKEKTLM